MERLLRAFANKRRLMILGLLKERKKMSVTELAYGIKLSLRSTSRHLSVLSHADLVDREQRGLTVFYTIAPKLDKLAKDILHHL